MLDLDRKLFALLNGTWTSPWLDEAMSLVTNEKLWAPFLAVIWLWLLLGFAGRWRPLALCLLVAAGLSDLTSARVLKPLVQRSRPCCVEPQARLLLPCKGSKSFPSSHAANTGAVAGVVWAEAGAVAGLPVLALALTVAWSRVYVGVHYPFDVFSGLCLGLAIARIVVLLRRRFWPALPPAESPSPGGLVNQDPAGTESAKEKPTGAEG